MTKRGNPETMSKDPNNKYVDCDNCAMEPLCVPIETNKQPLTLTETYLSRRISTDSGQALFVKDEPISAIYAVSSGTFKLTLNNENNEEKVMGFRFAGELIGEDALHPEKYAYNAVAIGKSSVCKVDVSELKACCEVIPNLQLNLVDLLTRQSSISQTEFQALIAKKSAESLLAAFLLNIAKRKSAHDGTKDSLNLSISRDNIANFLGLRRETLSRIFSKLQKEELIKVEGKQIQLIEFDKLTHLANL